MAISADELNKSVEENGAERDMAEKDLEEFRKSFQAQHEAGQKQWDDTKSAIKEAGFGMMHAVAVHKKSGKSVL